MLQTGRPYRSVKGDFRRCATPRAMVYAGLMTSRDARSWYMISEDAKSWVCLHIFTVVLHNLSTIEILAQRLGGGTGGRAGKGGCRTRGRSGDQGNGGIGGRGDQVSGQGSDVNDDFDGVHDFSTIIAQQLQNLLSPIL
ncbi:hypothetical protein Tco_1407536 [Tanacetum coccineum]